MQPRIMSPCVLAELIHIVFHAIQAQAHYSQNESRKSLNESQRNQKEMEIIINKNKTMMISKRNSDSDFDGYII